MKKLIRVRDYDYHVNITGSGQPHWLFLHGFLGNQTDFQAIQPRGTEAYITLYGFAPHDPVVPVAGFTADQQVQALASVITHLHFQPVNLVGYSMGARLALCLALAAPHLINQLVLESGTPGLAQQSARQARQRADARKAHQIETSGLAPFVTHWEQLPLFQSQRTVTLDQQRHMHAMRCAHQPQNMANSLRYFGTGTMPNHWPNLSQLQPKTTIITGELDHKFTTIGAKMHPQIPVAHHHLFQQTGHNVHFERPLLYLATLNHLAEEELHEN
ncbi:2-succinyl-6-hydroxy-2,4-cyclohexadiene-1-carboxylate synthase [Fructilactobacillus hinvesii]|uniref:2-succinyl-6-hydroxy-2,4-cyclohexadiene-1-carboxylate synthase n=1 Tax=Fructilactobacillus hinvesii TaxID=2940300 RepID=A0ABY5BW58_9LACO|nr:2-succinyl-6-hydroxy-2,4-cyclohexadiene-1-carboxylate synthase [Fructilactobacillus hinvesii]USS88221.1 2-succinyl-6-hydroxy-2,4-cyclohexadiene-1-carboxylate synthase [Fructilactobacillus hinvesii]